MVILLYNYVDGQYGSSIIMGISSSVLFLLFMHKLHYFEICNITWCHEIRDGN